MYCISNNDLVEDKSIFTKWKRTSTSSLSGNFGGDYQCVLPTIMASGHSATTVTRQMQEKHDHADVNLINRGSC